MNVFAVLLLVSYFLAPTLTLHTQSTNKLFDIDLPKDSHVFTEMNNYLTDRNRLLALLHYIRHRRCHLRFKLKGICENNLPFFMWAQSIAKDIMDGNLEETV